MSGAAVQHSSQLLQTLERTYMLRTPGTATVYGRREREVSEVTQQHSFHETIECVPKPTHVQAPTAPA